MFPKNFSNHRKYTKKRKRSNLQVEHGTSTSIVMSATGGMDRESRKFYARLG